MSNNKLHWTMELDAFQAAYIAAALWVGVNDDNGPENDPTAYDLPIEKIAEETARLMMRDCDVFRLIVGEPFRDEMMTRPRNRSAEEYAGEDFWLTRNGHGAGFWDGDWEEINPKYGEEWGETLTWISELFGEFDLYLDGFIREE